MSTIAQQRGLTVATLIHRLSSLPADALVLIQADSACENLLIATDIDDMVTDDQYDLEGDIVALDGGVHAVLSAVELPYLVEQELGDLAADLAEW